MKLPPLKRALVNFKFDFFLILADNISFYERTSYLFRKYIAILLNKRKIKYLGTDFYYDNRFVPAIIEMYPREILNLSKKVDFNQIKNVLDVGANIGQFAYTLKKIYPFLRIHCFEPNEGVFQLLEKNMSPFYNVKAYNLALAEKSGKRDFYVSPKVSAEGSFYLGKVQQNANFLEIKQTTINTVFPDDKRIKILGLLKEYDLIKIDVEGAEIEVLKSLKKIKTRFFLIEVSGKDNFKKVIDLIKEFWGEIKIIDFSLFDKKSFVANLLVEVC